jgi:serine protease Do
MIRHDRAARRVRHFAVCFAVIAVAAALGFSGTARAQWEAGRNKAFLRTNPKFLDAFRDVVARPSRSTVRVRCDDEDVALGTIVGADGWILTKASVLEGKIVCHLKDGRDLEARIVGVHEGHDLALLRVNARGLTPVQWRASKEDAVGNWVASAGVDAQPVTVGVISVAARQVPASRAAKTRETAPGGYLGVILDEVAPEGVKIRDIQPGSAAAKAGLKVNDLVLAVAGKSVGSIEALQQALQKYKPGDVVAVHVKRSDKEWDIEAKLGKRQPERADIQNSMGSELSQRRLGFPHILQHDSVVKPRDCGGPLVDLDGKVIGINIARAGRTESYAIPAEIVQPLLPELMSGRLAPRREPEITTSK